MSEPETPLSMVLTDVRVARLARALAARSARVLTIDPPWRRAAVALVLTLGADDALSVLLIKRAAYVGDPWSGHIALPGGRQESGDASLEHTAARETLEETGLDLVRHGRFLGRLDDLQPRTPTLPKLIIAPFIAVVAEPLTLTLSSEVAEAFWVPLAALQDPDATREVVLELTGGPRTVSSIRTGEHTIWGLTERILRDFFELATPLVAGEH